jgi:hypothetical protein
VSAAEVQAYATDETTEDAGISPSSSTDNPPRKPGTFTSESAREARKRRGAQLQPTDSDARIESALRKAAAGGDTKAAETLIRWLQRPRMDATTDNSESLSVEELERLHAGLDRLACMEESALENVVGAIMEGRI